MVTSVITAALVTIITIDLVIALVTFVTKFRNVPVNIFAIMVILVTKISNAPMDTFAVMVAYVTNAHYWLLWLPRHSEVLCPADILLSC